nr:MAG TPA: hypothetical protein [Caudoviricetes sp.]
MQEGIFNFISSLSCLVEGVVAPSHPHRTPRRRTSARHRLSAMTSLGRR